MSIDEGRPSGEGRPSAITILMHSPSLTAAFVGVGLLCLALLAGVVLGIVPTLVLQLAIFLAISGALAWPPLKDSRTVSVWALWLLSILALVEHAIR